MADTIFYKTGLNQSVPISGELTSANFPPGYTITNIIQVDIGTDVTSLGDSVFNSAVVLASFTFNSPSSVHTIGSSVFWNTPLLLSITIPASVTSIGTGLVYNSGVTSITFEDNSQITTIVNGTFLNAGSLASCDFGDNSQLITINDQAFKDTTSLISITIPSSVTTISYQAFKDSGLSSITFEDTFQAANMYSTTFSTLDSIEVNMTNYTLNYFNGPPHNLTLTFNPAFVQAFFGATNVAIKLPPTIFTKNDNSISSLSITGALTSTDYPAGWTPSDIKKVDVGLGVTSIEGQGMFTGGAFSAADNLTTIIISHTVTSIGAGAFRISGGLTSALSSITFETGSTLTTINGTAFQTTANLTTITIPSSVTTIGANAFRFSGLTSITFEDNSQISSMDSIAFNSLDTIHVYMNSNTLTYLNTKYPLSPALKYDSNYTQLFFGATNVAIHSTDPPPPPPPTPQPEPYRPGYTNRPGPIQFCTSRFAKCNLNKKTNFSSGNVTIQGATNSQRISLLVKQSSYRHGAKLVFSDISLNQYGRMAGGPGGFGAPPRNHF